ncbi:hypothetical protein SEA_SKYSAND_69 [Gordonia phage Skysand]|uniref:Uncharacterized protein n=1 Tax=Gordonia phage Skysand TaxID=2301559 RepID=A0A385DTW2_9CAUD|nr:hypothetical protein KNU08_gp69 [Gordonia phage Skysand]AXQ62102.1 hypothetical protein SEA_SKYSAND_69 [Gordonia phage Skysand]
MTSDVVDLPLLRGSERKARPRGVLGEEGHHNWTGDEATYGVHQVTISRIKTGKDWSHVPIGGDLNGIV